MDYEAWIKELSEREGASVEQSDITRLQNTNEDDRGRLMSALEAQYDLRGRTGQTGSGPDSTERTRQGYGSGRDETADDGGPVRMSGSSGSSSPTQSWLSASSGPSSGAQVQRDPRADALYQQLLGRSQQGLAVNRNDPVIRAQADAYGAQTERARRNFVSDTAEREGPLANIQGERRMAAERQGQQSGAFEAELMGRELTARRQEIAQALAQMQGLLTADQEANLRMQLAEMDAQLAREGLGVQRRAQDFGMDQFLRDLALREWDTSNRWDYAYSGF